VGGDHCPLLGLPGVWVVTPVAKNPKDLSQMELDELLDKLVQSGRDDTPEFHAAYADWERREE
jgi:hypothetical protein